MVNIKIDNQDGEGGANRKWRGVGQTENSGEWTGGENKKWRRGGSLQYAYLLVIGYMMYLK